MGEIIKLTVVAGVSFGLLYWAVNNPVSASNMVSKVQSALIDATDYLDITFFDDEEEEEGV
jgi:hypothetical protein